MFDRRAPYIVQTLFYTSFVYLSALGCATKVRDRCLKRNFLREKSERALQFIYQGNKGKVDFAASSPFSGNALISKQTVCINFEEGVTGLRFRLAAASRELFASKNSDGQEKGRKGGKGNVSVQGTELITLKILYTDKLAASPCR